MFVKVSLAAAFFLMMGAPLAGASESARTSAISTLCDSRSLDRSSIVVAQDDSSDSANSDNDSGDSKDSADKDDKDDKDDEDSDNEQSAQTDQNAQQQAPDADAGEAGQLPLNAYPHQVNPNQ
jgi:hypothetical protein